ncbi:Uncharacterised protein [Turicibacter sanguinis]|nr:Uncharacterised protein [Turicibacter sanguinis]
MLRAVMEILKVIVLVLVIGVKEETVNELYVAE